ncbi:hypothetical protein CFP65_5836 [Kitasatospora sp. MMS16-BH015]|uniref:NAD-dependent epimerase/dehydratase family protein n=1 Tax=Kitasatospora sp. MMS16-BH015 TaxID=2018025 RepID=UPI000CA26A85|nr:NAD-dependent epimerase/dehydratase family protein [Kitasatospora sp. MMS16-BH015]AUG80518.1 hypothetical protein CFP65_5836 [Kitasatospora sp. MMS16-BH015]
MPRIAITGGAGFVGTNLALLARQRGHEVILVDTADRLGRLRHSGLLDSAACEFLDLADPGAAFAAEADVFVHLAALPHVDYSLFHPETAVRNNTAALLSVLSAARATGTPVLFTSSIEVYGGNDGPLFREEDAPLPLSPYAASKIGAEHIVDSYRINYGLRATTVRLTNLYGPWQAPDRIIPRIVLQALLDTPSEAVTGRLRDFLYVEDAAEALLLLATGEHTGETFNLAAGQAVALEEVAAAVITAAGSGRFTTVDSPPRDGRGPSLVATSDRLNLATGWRPTVPLAEGIRRTADWYRDNRAWWSRFEPLVTTDRRTADFLADHVLPLTLQVPA